MTIFDHKLSKMGQIFKQKKTCLQTNHKIQLKCGFLKKSFIMNATLVSCPSLLGAYLSATANPPKSGNGQLTRGAFIINYFIRNIHFRYYCIKQQAIYIISSFMERICAITYVRFNFLISL